MKEDMLVISQEYNDREKEIKAKVEEKQRVSDEYIDFLRLQTSDDNLDEIKRRYSEVQWCCISAFEVKGEIGEDHPYIKRMIKIERGVSAETYKYFNKLFQDGMMSLVSEVVEGDTMEVYRSAGYNGNIGMVMIGRFNNPKIRSQLVQFIYLDRKCEIYSKNTPTEDEVSQNIDELIEAISNSTPITFTGVVPSGSMAGGVRENMDILWKPAGNQVYGTLQKSYIEAHEKGHTVRKIRSVTALEYVNQGFDFSAIPFSDERISQLISWTEGIPEEKKEHLNRDKVIETVLEYMRHPAELIERMSQLKNYYGMFGDEVFTRQHLKYARAHYIEDTKIDNYMTEFFHAITPETEDRFLELINSCGV
jgi:hypothetical protein